MILSRQRRCDDNSGVNDKASINLDNNRNRRNNGVTVVDVFTDFLQRNVGKITSTTRGSLAEKNITLDCHAWSREILVHEIDLHGAEELTAEEVRADADTPDGFNELLVSITATDNKLRNFKRSVMLTAIVRSLA